MFSMTDKPRQFAVNKRRRSGGCTWFFERKRMFAAAAGEADLAGLAFPSYGTLTSPKAKLSAPAAVVNVFAIKGISDDRRKGQALTNESIWPG
jgi:hypothetical protein